MLISDYFVIFILTILEKKFLVKVKTKILIVQTVPQFSLYLIFFTLHYIYIVIYKLIDNIIYQFKILNFIPIHIESNPKYILIIHRHLIVLC